MEEECCGNGCVNCILDTPRSCIRYDDEGKRNILADYRKYELLSKRCHNPNNQEEKEEDLVELHFRASTSTEEEESYTLQVPPGWHVMMRLFLQAGEIKHLRPYSPYWIDCRRLEFKILVNLKPQGHASHHLHQLPIAGTVEFRGPIGVYAHVPSTSDDKRLIIITQGVGIAPALRIIEEVLDNEEDVCRITHLACFQDLQHVYFRERLRDFNQYWNYHSRCFLAHQQQCCCEPDCEHFLRRLWYKEDVLTRRMSADDVREVASENCIFIVSGARAFQDAIAKMAAGLDMRKHVFLL